MNRDAYPDFLDASEDLRGRIAAAVEEHELGRMLDGDRPHLERLIRFWRSKGKPETHFRMERETGCTDLETHDYTSVPAQFGIDNDGAP